MTNKFETWGVSHKDNFWSSTPAWPNRQNLSVPIPSPDPMTLYDAMSRDEVLIEWDQRKRQLEKAKEAEMEMRQYIVKRAFPDPKEGVNRVELGNGYELKATVKYHYNLDSDLDKVEAALEAIEKVGNIGPFMAERLVKFEAKFLLTEYRKLCDPLAGEDEKKIKKIIDSVLTIIDASPTLEIKKPK